MNFPASKCRNVAGGTPGGMFPPELKRIKKLHHQFSLVIKLSLTSWRCQLQQICAFFSLILLTFHHGKINISKSKNNWQNKKEISIKIFFTISVWKLLLWFKHWPISLYFVFPPLSESELSLTGCTGECFPFCPVIPFISAAILNCYSLARITPSTPLKPLEAF